MSMLAEPRRKQRVGPNPRGKFFTEDEDNKGRNLLQKMGWRSGDGLGVQRQGIKDPIRPKIQSDAKGLGFDVKNDAWISHTDDFNAILKNLQVAHGVKEEEEIEEEQSSSLTTMGFGFQEQPTKPQEDKERLGLETKSKASRSRIHYHKFVKNKDLSKIKDKDWGCIFGKDVSQQQQEQGARVDKDCIIQDIQPPPPPPFDYSRLLNGNTAQNKYKIQMLKSFTKSTLLEDQLKPYDGTEVVVDAVVVEKLEKPSCDIEPEEDVEEEPRKKKKKSKNKEKSLEAVAADEDIIIEEPRKKKKKKSKRQEESDETVEQNVEIVIVEDQEEDEPPRKKKKKSKKRSPSPENVVEIVEEVKIGEEDIDAPLRKKKKKSKKRSPSPDTVVADVTTINDEVTEESQPNDSIINLENSTTTTTLVDDDASSSANSAAAATGNFNRRTISSEEMHAAAAVFKGSNLLQIPGYRNQSSKLL